MNPIVLSLSETFPPPTLTSVIANVFSDLRTALAFAPLPLPPEMFHPHVYCVATEKDEAMCKLLDIPLRCMVCNKVIKQDEK